MKFKRKVVFHPAFDKRNADPKKNYGIHNVVGCFYLIGEKGVIQFQFSTNWHLPHVEDEMQNEITKALHNCGIRYPWGTDIGYHSPIPMYEDQQKMKTCQFYPDGCYYDGSTLNAEPYAALLVEKGSEAVWKKMKNEYKRRFGKEK